VNLVSGVGDRNVLSRSNGKGTVWGGKQKITGELGSDQSYGGERGLGQE